ncbi:Flp pilus assembly protein CpaB [Paenibacillus koleovorans]|uniref:Flp pilus assembly protein CpaB n=1 Tax=Paenibacillus koleovorans TaxID=121608 RepID=UPI000FD71303|nr:Flp pilus assembly protein CpaB [Paenibacillus koleovorans]
MNRNLWLKSLLGIVLSVCIAFYVNVYLKSLREEVAVVVAAKDISPETKISADMLTTVKVNTMDQNLLVPNAVLQLSDVVGSIAMTKIKAGSVIQKEPTQIMAPIDYSSSTSPASGDVKKSFFIPPDKRIITLKLDGEGSVAFALKKGDKVDVIFTSMASETNGIYSSLILQKIEVFDAEVIADKDKTASNTAVMQNVTLLVTPQEAQDLALAKRKGKIDLALVPATTTGANNAEMPINPTYPTKFTTNRPR